MKPFLSFFLTFFLFTTVSHAIRFDYPFFFTLTQDNDHRPQQQPNNLISVGHAFISSDSRDPNIRLPTETQPKTNDISDSEPRKTYKGPTELDVKLFQLVNRHGSARLRNQIRHTRCRHHHLHKLLRFPGRVGPAREVAVLRDRHVAREFPEGVEFVVPMQNYRLRQRDHDDDDGRVEIKSERVDGDHEAREWTEKMHHRLHVGRHHHHGRHADVEHEKKWDGINIINMIRKFLGYYF